jgi:hypothetical protein
LRISVKLLKTLTTLTKNKSNNIRRLKIILYPNIWKIKWNTLIPWKIQSVKLVQDEINWISIKGITSNILPLKKLSHLDEFNVNFTNYSRKKWY